MTAAALLRRLAQPALDAYQNTVTVTVPTRLLTALADELDTGDSVLVPAYNPGRSDAWNEDHQRKLREWRIARAEVERAAKEHTSQ